MSEPNSIDNWPASAEDLSVADAQANASGGTVADFDDSGDFIEAVRGLYGEPPAGPNTSTQRTARSSQGN